MPPPGLSIPHTPYIYILYPRLLGLSCPILASAYPAILLVFLYPLEGLISYISYQFLLGLDIPMKLLKITKLPYSVLLFLLIACQYHQYQADIPVVTESSIFASLS